MVYLITYDLLKPQDKPQDYSDLIAAIEEGFPDHLHLQKSVWLVESARSPDAISEKLSKSVPDSAYLFVTRLLRAKWHSLGLPARAVRWLNSHAEQPKAGK